MKRKTWKDRRCGHGNLPVMRIQYDLIHCERPECWKQALRSCGMVSVRDREGLETALAALAGK